jgi:hypothetical protein
MEMKLRPVPLGVAVGLLWGVLMMLTTWLSVLTGYAEEFLRVMAGSIYPGYSISPLGGLVVLAYGFLDGFVMAVVVAWLYNRLS